MHREERQFSVQLNLFAEFVPDYEGEEDGFAWFERFERELKPRIVSAIFDVLRQAPGWEAIAAPRGRDPELGLDIAVRRRVPAAP
ncbi:MAG TPA: hypothetical protein VGP93_16355 [Polyangiaceae bacterium]|jgi:hypothetical protein|nr:hypothetical protein [Polyangiaceae bacterium]